MAGVARAFWGMRTWAQKGGGTPKFYNPMGVVCDASGNIYVADSGNHAIRMVTPAGVVSTLAGLKGTSGFTDGTGTAARFNTPVAIIYYAGDLYVADSVNLAVRKVTLAGVVTTIGTIPGTAGYDTCQGVAIDASGNYYEASGYSTDPRYSSLIYKNGALYAGGSFINWNGTVPPASNVGFRSPSEMAIDAAGSLFIVDVGFDMQNYAFGVRKINPATGAVTTFSTPFNYYKCSGVCFDGGSNLFVSGDHQIDKVIISTAAASLLAGQADSGYLNGVGAAAKFYFPSGVAVDGGGNLYVGDTGNQVIRKIVLSSATVSLLAGTFGVIGENDS
jgi:hypothetical protein